MLACSSSDKLHSGQRLEVYLNRDSLQWDNEVESGLLLSRKECLEVSTLFEIMINTLFVNKTISDGGIT